MIRNSRIFKCFHHLFCLFSVSEFCCGEFKPENDCHEVPSTNHNLDCQARVEALEARVQELEAEQELHELRAIVEAQEACACARNVSFFRHVF